MTETEKADDIWNRACSTYATALLAGDMALIKMLRLHGHIMNGGVLHGIEAMDSNDGEFQIEAYRPFGLDDVADILEDTKSALQTEDDTGALEAKSNARHYDWVQNDRRLFDAFGSYLRSHPEHFAP
jgi:hypothetical protein